MSDNLKVFQVFIASPNDLVDERRAIKEVSEDLNSLFGKTLGLQIQLLGWEDRLPGFGRAQAQINEDVDKADLFIGFLWRRWGSDPGNPDYSSGFEEEFSRAFERRQRSGSPEISIFFKEVSIKAAAEMDDQLKRVFDFRKTVASKILFGDFANIEEWRKKTRELLHGHLLMLVKNMLGGQAKVQPQAPPATSSDESSKSATGQTGKTSTAAAIHQAVQVWTEAQNAITNGELSRLRKSEALEKLKIARLGLIASAMTNRDIEAEMPGIHLTNLLFKSRRKIQLTQLEWLLVLRGNLATTTGYQPGWYWIGKASLNLRGALIYFAIHDEHRAVRLAALDYATQLKLPLQKKNRDGQAPIEALCAHDDPDTRKAALEFLADLGTSKELVSVEKLRGDSDSDVRAQAEITNNAILLRQDASHFFENSVLVSPWVNDDSIRAVQTHVAHIGSVVLRKGLSHPDTKVQAFVAKELIRRDSIDFSAIQKLKNAEGSSTIFRTYFLRRIAEGQRFSPQEIRDGLRPGGLGLGSLFGYTAVNVDEVLNELFKLYAYEEIVTIANSESDDASIAYRFLAEKHFVKFGSQVRADLKADFAEVRLRQGKLVEPSLPATFSLSGLFQSAIPDVSELIVAALSGLAIHGNGTDRDLVLPFVESKTERVRIAAIICLRQVGRPQDKDMLLKIADESGGEVGVEAAKTAMFLVPTEVGSASQLLKSGKPEYVRLALVSILNVDPRKVWLQIEDRLYDENEDIRKLVCAYAIKKFLVPRLVKLLDAYLAKDRYFYNIVYFLDRAIYAKPPLRKIFNKEVEATLDSPKNG